MAAEHRFKKRIQVDEKGCWLWTGCLNSQGYGCFAGGPKRNGKSQLVLTHRWSYEFHVGPIPEDLQIDHLCRVKRCANPAHLEPVTQSVNMRRAVGDLCIHGHPLSGENLRLRRDGRRICRECNRRMGLESWHRTGKARREARKAVANA